MICPNCGTDNDQRMNFCRRCGTPLNNRNNNIDFGRNPNNRNSNNIDLNSMYSTGEMNSNNRHENSDRYFDDRMRNSNNNTFFNNEYSNNDISFDNMSSNNMSSNNFFPNNMNDNSYPINNRFDDTYINNNMQYNMQYNNMNPNNNYNNMQYNNMYSNNNYQNYNNINYIQNQKNIDKQKKNGIISFIVGIISIILTFIISFFALPIAIVGLILALKAKKSGIAGIILNMISILIITVSLIFVGVAFNRFYYPGTYNCTSVEDEVLVNEFGHSMELKLYKNYVFSINADNAYGLTAIDGTYDIENIDSDSKEGVMQYNLLFQTNHRIVENASYANEYTSQYTLEVQIDKVTLTSSRLDSKYICKKIK